MSRAEGGFHGESPREALFARARVLPEGSYALGEDRYARIPHRRIQEEGSSSVTLEVFDVSANIFDTGEYGWHAHRITFSDRSHLGMPRKMGVLTAAILDRGFDSRPTELTGIEGPRVRIAIDDYASALADVHSPMGDFLQGTPIVAEKVGEFVERNLNDLFVQAGDEGGLHSQVTKYQLPFRLTRGQPNPDGILPEVLDGKSSDNVQWAEFPLENNNNPVRIIKFIDNPESPTTLFIPDEDGYRTYSVDSSDMSLKRVVLDSRFQDGFVFLPISAQECIDVIKLLDFLKAPNERNPWDKS